MPTLVSLTPKKRAALASLACGTLRRCKFGYRLADGAAVHTKRVANQLAADGLAVVSEFETTVSITPLGSEVAAVNGLAVPS